MPANNEELVKYLTQLIETTNSGKMKWVKENPTTFTWTTNNPRPARIIVQKVDRQRRVQSIAGFVSQTFSTYVFQVIEPNTNIQRLSIDEPSDPELQKVLGALYSCVQSSILQSGVDFLKSILPGS